MPLKQSSKGFLDVFLRILFFYGLFIRLWNNENQFVKFGEKKLSTHIVQEEDCFGSATIGLEVIWLPASGYWWDGDAGPSLARSTVKAYTEQSEKDCGVLSPLWCWRLNNTDSKDGTQASKFKFQWVQLQLRNRRGFTWNDFAFVTNVEQGPRH